MRVAVAPSWRGAVGISIALHGAIALAAVLPVVKMPPPPGSPMVVSLAFAPAEAGAGSEPANEVLPTSTTQAPPPDAAMAAEAPEMPVAALPEPAEAALPEPAAAPPVRMPTPPPRPAPPRPVARPHPPAQPGIRPVPAGAGGAEAAATMAASAAAIAPSAAMAATTPPLPILVTAPRYRLRPTPPAYPPRAVELGLTGTVLVRARVTPDGSTEETRLWRSSGHPLLDYAALSAVRRWAFEPASVEGRRVEAWVEVPVHFRLN